MSLYYVDTSAALKLLVEESHSKAFAAFYDGAPGATWVSSALLRIDVMRAVTRVFPAVLPDARGLLSTFDFVSIDDDIVDTAMNEPDRKRLGRGPQAPGGPMRVLLCRGVPAWPPRIPGALEPEILTSSPQCACPYLIWPCPVTFGS